MDKVRNGLDQEEKAKRLSLKRSVSNESSFKQKKTKLSMNLMDSSTKPDDLLTEAKAVAADLQVAKK